MTKEAAIAGIGQVGYDKARDSALDDIIFEAVNAALADSGVDLHGIDSVMIACSDQIDGRAISGMITSCPAGAHLKDEINTASAPEHAAILAYMRILAGIDRTSLVVSWSKCSEAPVILAESLSTDPLFERDLGITAISAAAMQAASYRGAYGLSDGLAAEVAARSRAKGMKNPHVTWDGAPDRGTVLRSPYLCWPIRELEMTPFSDGACALVMASAEVAEKLAAPRAWVTGVGWASDTYWLADRDKPLLNSTRLAAKQAYKMAGTNDPRQEVDVVELHDISAYHWFMACEALGLAGDGRAVELLEDELLASERITINPSGGALSTSPGFATGLVRVAEAALQVQGRAGRRQVPGAKLAIAHALSGLGGQNASVFVLAGDL